MQSADGRKHLSKVLRLSGLGLKRERERERERYPFEGPSFDII